MKCAAFPKKIILVQSKFMSVYLNHTHLYQDHFDYVIRVHIFNLYVDLSWHESILKRGFILCHKTHICFKFLVFVTKIRSSSMKDNIYEESFRKCSHLLNVVIIRNHKIMSANHPLIIAIICRQVYSFKQ